MKAKLGNYKQHRVEPKDPWEMLQEKHAIEVGGMPNARWLLTVRLWLQKLLIGFTGKNG